MKLFSTIPSPSPENSVFHLMVLNKPVFLHFFEITSFLYTISIHIHNQVYFQTLYLFFFYGWLLFFLSQDQRIIIKRLLWLFSRSRCYYHHCYYLGTISEPDFNRCLYSSKIKYILGDKVKSVNFTETVSQRKGHHWVKMVNKSH